MFRILVLLFLLMSLVYAQENSPKEDLIRIQMGFIYGEIDLPEEKEEVKKPLPTLFDLRDLTTSREPNQKPLYKADEILEIIKTEITPKLWGKSEGISIQIIKEQLLVVHHQKAITKIQNILTALRQNTYQKKVKVGLSKDRKSVKIKVISGNRKGKDEIKDAKEQENQEIAFPTEEQWKHLSRTNQEFDLKLLKINKNQYQTIYKSILQSLKTSIMKSPALTVLEKQRFVVSILNQTSYISQYKVKKEEDSFISDPVIETARTGWEVEGVAKIIDKATQKIAFQKLEFKFSELERPIREVQTKFGIIQLPNIHSYSIIINQELAKDQILLIGPFATIWQENDNKPIWISISSEIFSASE